MTRRIRILLAKPGLDGHDRGAKIIARLFRDAGMEVIYTGLHQTPEQIVQTAIEEDVDVIALSILSGAHLPICKKILQLMKKENIKVGAGLALPKLTNEKILIVGGTIMEEDIPVLKQMGVAEVFPPGSEIDAGVQYLKNLFKDRED